MELLFRLQPEPTTLKAALQALRLAESRLSVAIKWIISYHGQCPSSLHAELLNANPETGDQLQSHDYDAPSTLKSRRKFRNTNSTYEFVKPTATEAVPYLQPEFRNLAEDDFESHISPAYQEDELLSFSPNNDLIPTSSTTALDLLDSVHGPVKIVDIRTITGESSAISGKEVKIEPTTFSLQDHHCPNCPAAFESLAVLSVHRLVHARLRINRVDLDNRQQRPKRRLRTRTPKCNIKEQEREKCDLCPRTFSTESALSNHLLKVHKRPMPCEKCGLRLPTNTERNEHMRTEHPELKHRYKCDQCESSFLLDVYLQHHKKNIHPGPNRGVTCEVCGKFCKNRQTLKLHLKWNHVDPSEAVTCSTCGVAVKSAELLKTHMLLHRPRHLCQICGHSFRVPSLLNLHMQTRHNNTNRPYKCEHCTATFKEKSGLKRHINRHFQKGQKACPYCGIEKLSHDLYNHINIVHKGRKYKCPLCPSMCSLRADLKKHHALKHPGLSLPPDSELEVIYTKSPEDPNNQVQQSDNAKKTATSRFKARRSRDQEGITCNICLRAVFITRAEFDLHMQRHENDPDYKMRRRVPVQRLNPPSLSQDVTEEHEQPETWPSKQLNQNQNPTSPHEPFGGNVNGVETASNSRIEQETLNPFLELHHHQQHFTSLPPVWL